MANAEMESLGELKRAWKTPARKLVWFFKASRDKWKAKYGQQMKKNKLLSNQVRAVETSRDRWKQVAQEARQEARRFQEELEREKESRAHA